MTKIDVAKIWSLNYRLLMSVITSVAPAVSALGLEPKELFLLAEVDEHPHPAELAEDAVHAEADGDGQREAPRGRRAS